MTGATMSARTRLPPAPARPRVSAALRAAVRLHHLRAYRIAQECDLHPTTVSKLVNGIEAPRLDDPRVLRLAAFLGVSAEDAFE